jgi:isoleucyl-tRNA synthetase
LFDWPSYDEKMINPTLEEEFRVAKEVITIILAKREEVSIGVRWPLARAEVMVENSNILKKVEELVRRQTNIKKLLIKKGALKVELDTTITPSLEQEGFAREIGRRIQALRKKAGLKRNDKVKIIETEFELEKQYADELKEKVGASELIITKKIAGTSANESAAEIKSKKFRFILV